LIKYFSFDAKSFKLKEKLKILSDYLSHLKIIDEEMPVPPPPTTADIAKFFNKPK